MRALPGAPQGTDPAAVAAYLARGYVPEGMSIHAGITKLRPGRVLTLRPGAAPEETLCRDFAALAGAGRAAPAAGDAGARARHLEEVLHGPCGTR